MEETIRFYPIINGKEEFIMKCNIEPINIFDFENKKEEIAERVLALTKKFPLYE